MPFLILAFDHPDMEKKREATRESHRAYLAEQGARLLASGALLADDGIAIIGGASLLDVASRQEAEEFERRDPYALAGIRAKVEIRPWRLRWWSGAYDPSGKAWKASPSSVLRSD